jgi:hypothetical protein
MQSRFKRTALTRSFNVKVMQHDRDIETDVHTLHLANGWRLTLQGVDSKFLRPGMLVARPTDIGAISFVLWPHV